MIMVNLFYGMLKLIKCAETLKSIKCIKINHI